MVVAVVPQFTGRLMPLCFTYLCWLLLLLLGSGGRVWAVQRTA